MWLITHFYRRFLYDFQVIIGIILICVIPLLLILLPLWWWSHSFLFVSNLFQSLTGRSLIVIVPAMIMGIFLTFYVGFPEFSSNKTFGAENTQQYFQKNEYNEKFWFVFFSAILYLLFLLFFLYMKLTFTDVFWREVYVRAVIFFFPLYISLPLGLLIGIFFWFWLYVLKFAYYGLRGQLEKW